MQPPRHDLPIAHHSALVRGSRGRSLALLLALGAALVAWGGTASQPGHDAGGVARAAAPDGWETGPALPAAIGEVAGGIIGGTLYLVGEGDDATFAYDLGDDWRAAGVLAQRPFAGNHHAAEVVGGKLYLFGGFGDDSRGKVQIYDPATNRWSLGAAMPWAAGSSSSALIGGMVYVVGGIVGSATTTQAEVYDPATNRWSTIAPLPQGRNHAAAGTDGVRLYLFGGRGPGSGDSNVVANGFDTLQIYDPSSDRWESSLAPGSALAALPQARGGMGKAVYAGGEFYVIGGETKDGAGATSRGVYSRVDIYNPRLNSWRRGAELPTARHGIFPLRADGRIYVAGGGVKSAFSGSAVLEIYILPAAAPTRTATSTATKTRTATSTATKTNTATGTPTGAATTPTPGRSPQTHLFLPQLSAAPPDFPDRYRI